jgi:methyl-accepting chemotaxis protein
MAIVLSNLRRFSIRTRMAGAIVMVLSLFCMIGAAGLGGGFELKRMNDDFMHQSLKSLETLAHLGTALDGMSAAEQTLALGDKGQQKALTQQRPAWDEHHKKAKESLLRLNQAAKDENSPAARQLGLALEDYAAAAQAAFKSLETSGPEGAELSNRALRAAVEKSGLVRDQVGRLEQEVRQNAQQLYATSLTLIERLAWAFGAMLLVVVALVVPLTLANSASITKPILYAQSVARNIASGDLSGQIQVEGRDEASQMLAALNEMQQSLTRMVGELRESSSTIRQTSLEVASGSSDLSQRTELSAGNLQRTASSMLQLTQTVRQSAESAETANQLARSAADIAQRGGDVVAQVVATMDDIHTSSRKIGDIIGTIDSIAFQTNILALNAAVEAARAGEQGRGFAVVASEVRALAQRSASAAREIKTLIDSSVARVEDGSRLVKDAGATMVDIVDSVQRVSNVIGEITTSTREQSQGITQVNGAIGELDQMTQQNAALVEQSAAASANLGEQATRLHEVVKRFQLVETQ